MKKDDLFVVEKMFILPEAGMLMAFCDVCVGGIITIKGIRITNGKKGLFIGLPREQAKDNKWYDTVCVKDATIFDHLSNIVLAEYKQKGGKP